MARSLPAIGQALMTLAWRQADTPVDLDGRRTETRDWFAGKTVYGRLKAAMYPPATYAILFPALGRTSLAAARFVFAISGLWALIYIAYAGIRAADLLPEMRIGGDHTIAPLLCIVAAISANHAILSAVTSGQFVLQALAVLVAAMTTACRPRTRDSLAADVLAAMLFVLAMAKPQVALLFGWTLLFKAGRLRIVFMAAIAYAALTLVACTFQGSNLWTAQAHQFKWAARNAMPEGYGNINLWLASAGLGRWIIAAWVLLASTTAAWVYLNRRADLWILVGLTAIVARIWCYHRAHDDVLLILPLIALFRIARQTTGPAGRLAMLLFAVLSLAMFFQAGHGRLALHGELINTVHVAVWFATAGFLMWAAPNCPAIRIEVPIDEATAAMPTMEVA